MTGPAVIRVLIVEDFADDAELVAQQLRRGGMALTYERVETAGEMAEALRSHPPDLVISDCKMPEFDAEEALHVLRESGLEVPFIVVSGQVGEEAAADLMRGGARDFVLKDDLTRLVVAVERELRETAERQARERAREELERQLHQAERLDSLGQLAGGIAHDFNNLIGVIKGCAELALGELSDGHPAHADVVSIGEAADQAASLTSQLLIFSQLQPSRPEVLGCNEVIEDTARLLQRALGEDIELITRLEPDLDAVTIERGRLQQVIMNLAVNARSAMPDGGRLIIQTAPANDHRQHEPPRPGAVSRWVRLTCTDTGCGMSQEVAARAFEPFYSTKGAGGSGLGLATVYGVVKDARGDITLWSEPGTGTRIDIYLPSAGRLHARPGAGGSEPPRAGGQAGRILVVEDNPQIGDVAQRILTIAGYQVTVRTSRHEALRVAADEGTGLDLLLTDLVMPGISAREFIDTVWRSRPGLPVLLMSGYAPSRGDLPALDLPLVAKPFDAATLLRKVRAVLAASLTNPAAPPG
jgi:signal transduction histidine kinase